MKKITTNVCVAIVAFALAFVFSNATVTAFVLSAARHRFKTADPQVAAGEWKIEVQTPPCDGYKNIQVIFPKESGAPIAIECDLMPVQEK